MRSALTELVGTRWEAKTGTTALTVLAVARPWSSHRLVVRYDTGIIRSTGVERLMHAYRRKT